MAVRIRDSIDQTQYLTTNQEVYKETICQPDDVLQTIFSYLNFNGLVTVDSVSRQWKASASDPNWLMQRIYNENACGIKQWKLDGRKKFLWGKEGTDIKALPDDIGKIFKSLCPVHHGKRVWETHSLVWVSKDVNLRNYGEIAAYGDTDDRWISEKLDKSTDESHWILVTDDPLPENPWKSYAGHEKMVTELAKKASVNYSMPTRFEAVAYALARRLIFKVEEQAFDGLYIDCQKEISESNAWINGRRVIVGGSSPAGLNVYNLFDYDRNDIGVVALRKFYWSLGLDHLVKGS